MNLVQVGGISTLRFSVVNLSGTNMTSTMMPHYKGWGRFRSMCVDLKLE